MAVHFLTNRQVELLKEMVDEYLHRTINVQGRQPSNYIDNEEILAPEFYVAKAPVGGIPAMRIIGGIPCPGYADCVFYALRDQYNPPRLETLGFSRRVYNITFIAVPGNAYLTPSRTKTGGWSVPWPGFGFQDCDEESGTGSGSGSGSGSPSNGNCCVGDCADGPTHLFCTVTNKVGCYNDLPDSLLMCCYDYAPGFHLWSTGITGSDLCNGVEIIYCDTGFNPSIVCYHGTGTSPQLEITVLSGDTVYIDPESGYTCNPFSAVYFVNDGSGNSCTITVVS